GVTVALLMSIHPALVLLAVFAIPTVLTSTWRPAVERRAEERAAPANRLARHLFTGATTAPPGQEVRVTGIGDRLLAQPRRSLGARLWARRCSTMELGDLAHTGMGPVRRRLRRRRRVRVIGPQSAGGERPARPRGWIAPVGVHRRDGRRDRIPSRLLDVRIDS